MSPDRLPRIAQSAGIVVIAIGSTGLLGWLLSAPALTTVLPGLASMKTNTAVSLVLGGASLLLQVRPPLARRRLWMSRFCALLVSAVAVLTLIEYVVDEDLGIDRLLLPAGFGDSEASVSHRMAPNTALGLGLAGVSLGLLETRVTLLRRVREAFALLVLLIGYVAVTGYLLDVTALHGVPGYTSMAMHTAFGLIALSTGVLAARPEDRIAEILAQRNPAGAAIRRLLPLLIAIPWVVAWVRLEGQRAGYYGTEFGIALMVTVDTCIIVALALWNARAQGVAENERQRASERASEQFRSAIEAAPTGMLMVDRAGKIVLVNAQIEKLFGYGREELMRQQIEMLVPQRFRDRHPDYRSGFSDEPKARLMGGGRDLYGLRKDGTEVPIEIGLNPLRTADGEFILSSVADITERKRAEREKEELMGQLKTLNSDLEERVRMRTGELTNSLKEREVLLQEVHHRVKNNLQVISSLINMQVRKLDEGTSRDALEECQTRVQTIALIHEQLYQSKDYARVPFSEYTRSLASNVFQALGVSPATVSLELVIEDLELAVDKAIPCGLVLNELITNSLKHGFSHGRSGKIRVELARLEGRRLRLAVKDNGVGLPEGFDIHKSESLGLQLICTLAAQLDAALEVSAQAGDTSFQLTFPVEA